MKKFILVKEPLGNRIFAVTGAKIKDVLRRKNISFNALKKAKVTVALAGAITLGVMAPNTAFAAENPNVNETPDNTQATEQEATLDAETVATQEAVDKAIETGVVEDKVLTRTKATQETKPAPEVNTDTSTQSEGVAEEKTHTVKLNDDTIIVIWEKDDSAVLETSYNPATIWTHNMTNSTLIDQFIAGWNETHPDKQIDSDPFSEYTNVVAGTMDNRVTPSKDGTQATVITEDFDVSEGIPEPKFDPDKTDPYKPTETENITPFLVAGLIFLAAAAGLTTLARRKKINRTSSGGVAVFDMTNGQFTQSVSGKKHIIK